MKSGIYIGFILMCLCFLLSIGENQRQRERVRKYEGIVKELLETIHEYERIVKVYREIGDNSKKEE